MGRTANDHRPNLKPVTKVALDERYAGLRIAFVVVLILIAGCAFAYGVMSLLQSDPGWEEIEANSGSVGTYADEFVLLYELGAGDTSPTAEKKALTLVYTEALQSNFQRFNYDREFEGIQNVYTLNHHPNEVIEVDDVLYSAFSLLEQYGNRNIYLAPVYARYDDMFFCEDDALTFDYDPSQNDEVAAEYQAVADFAADPNQVHVQLLGDGKVRLFVSEAYLAYAEENGIDGFIDFFWMKNAFIVDNVAKTLASNGFTHGTLTSYDGFSRNLDDRDLSYSCNIFDRAEEGILQAAFITYTGSRSFVTLRDYWMSEQDRWHYYVFSDGETRSSYLDLRDGRCRSAVPTLLCYSGGKGCAQILLEVSPVYIADTLDQTALVNLDDVGFVYCEDRHIYYDDPALRLSLTEDGAAAQYIPVCCGAE